MRVHALDRRLPSRGAPIPERLFRYLLDLEIEKANRLRYCLSLVCLTPDLDEPQVGADLTRAIARIALRNLRSTDLATTLSRETVALLLVDTDPTMLARILDRTANAQLPEGRRFVRGRQMRVGERRSQLLSAHGARPDDTTP